MKKEGKTDGCIALFDHECLKGWAFLAHLCGQALRGDFDRIRLFFIDGEIHDEAP